MPKRIRSEKEKASARRRARERYWGNLEEGRAASRIENLTEEQAERRRATAKARK